MHKNQAKNFARPKGRKTQKRTRKSLKKAKPGAFWVLERMGTGEDGCKRMRKPTVRTSVNTSTIQHMQKENRQKRSVSAGFVSGAEGLEPSARGFGVDVGKRTGGTGEGQCCPVSNASPGEDGAGLVLWEIIRAKTGEKEREIPEKT